MRCSNKACPYRTKFLACRSLGITPADLEAALFAMQSAMEQSARQAKSSSKVVKSKRKRNKK